MPFRLFKPIKLGKGLKLNISKSGLGLSQKIGPVTVGTRRTTLDLPGTGASIYTKTGGTKTKKASAQSMAWLVTILVIILLCICGMLVFIFGALITGTPTPTPLNPSPIPLQETAPPPVSVPSSTSRPTITQPALRPTITIMPSSTLPDVLVTILPPAPISTTPPAGGTCACTGDLYNCADFPSHSAAQACYSFCINQGVGDIHKLDENNDGNACESLP